MIGGRFRRHDPIKRFTIHFVDCDHPITEGLEDYEHEDELYELTGDFVDRNNVVPVRGVRVLAEAEGHPMVYVKEHGAGRVVYLASGHDARSLGHPTYRLLFTRAVAWAARPAP
jgi:type 1 glutamine amidotransferase